ncbi:MAG TPA: hypothetical protein VKQ52_21340 [Puia sp.]|nr:hypothetical protein [Puia sp.]
MKQIKGLILLPLLAAVLFFGSFVARPEKNTKANILNYAWYTTDGQFVAWSTLANAEFVTGADTNPVNGTLVSLGYTGGDPGQPPSGTLVYRLYTHP